MTRAQIAGRTSTWLAWLAAATAGCQFEPSGATPPGDDPPADGGGGGGADGGASIGGDPVATDPFGDGTSFAYVVAYAGEVYVGPSRDGDALVRIDAGAATAVSLSFARDEAGNQSGNQGAPPYRGIGFSGCSPDGDCGPDDEDGRGLLASGAIAGGEILIAGGARSEGDLDYVYLTRDTGTALAFQYIDLSAVMGPASRGFSALHTFDDRVYAGFPDTGGARPYLVALSTLPGEGPGLDAVAGEDVENLDADAMPGLKTGGNAIIDDIADFAGLLYLANAGGWMRSTTARPRSYEVAPEDWSDVTPTADEYAASASRTTGKTADLEPADRAVPAFAVHRDRLYAARNTVDGPQIWACDPALTEPAAACDGADWRLVAAGLGDPDGAAVSLLVSTGEELYVGFDDPGGLRLFRSGADAPALASDFVPVGRAGLGDRRATRIFDGEPFGGDLYLAVGNGSDPVAIQRVPAP